MLADLVSSYFRFVNVGFPLLHRPSFERALAAGLHLRDEGFGAVVLLVCALSARHSRDPAVLAGCPGRSWHWAGWQWFEQVRTTRQMVQLHPTGVYDLQVAGVRRSLHVWLISFLYMLMPHALSSSRRRIWVPPRWRT